MSEKRKPKMVVFDFDGVILHSTDILFPIFNAIKMATSLSGKTAIPAEQFLRESWGVSGEDLMKKNFDPAIAPVVLSIIYSMDEFIQKNPIYCCDLELIKMLHSAGVKTGILTNRGHESLQKHTANNKQFFKDNFDLIVGIGAAADGERIPNFQGASHAKPDTRSFEPVLQYASNNGISKEDILFVGDAYTDMKAAENAGVAFAAVLTGALDKIASWTQFGVPAERIFESVDSLILDTFEL
jgi:phosphoglycolate phosphatase-like HAD superfamily hydrolase